jgi:glycerol-3-phosphate O-acyltransferase
LGVLFSDALDRLRRRGLVDQADLRVSTGAPDKLDSLGFMADLLRDFLEGYLAVALTLEDLARAGSMESRSFIKAAFETGRAEYLAGRISASEALSKPTMENAVLFLLDQQILVEEAKRLRLGPAAPLQMDELANRIRSFLKR